MITEEAISILRGEVAEVEWNYPMDYAVAIDTAIQALEKQISKKVTNNGYGVYFCPVCRGSVWQIRDESKYCFRCGQALDWSDENG
jgi:hypothetical protein